MDPLPYTWPAGAAFWAACAWSFAAEIPFTIRDRAAGAADRGSMQVVKRANAAGTLAAFFFASATPRFVMPFRLPIYIAGVATIIAGGVLRRHCFRMLGRHFTYDVRVAAGQPVVERGAYRYVRHPSYTAGLMLFSGVGLALTNWLSLMASSVIPLLGYAYRIHVEEQALLAGLGPGYADYMKRTRRIIPFVC